MLTYMPICIGSVMTLKWILRFENLVSKEWSKTAFYIFLQINLFENLVSKEWSKTDVQEKNGVVQV